MADAVIVDNNVAGYVLITTVITIITIILVYIFSNKGKETQLQNIKEDNQELEKNKNAGKSSKKRKGTAEKRKDVKTQFTHPWLLTTLKGHSGNVFDMDFSSNGKYLASCGEDRTVMLWNMKGLSQKDLKSVRVNVEYDHAIQVKWSPDGKAFITCQANGNNIQVYRVGKKEDGMLGNVEPILTFPEVHKDEIIYVGIACTGRFIMSCSKDTQLIIWDLKGEVLASIDTLHINNYYACVSPCGRFVASSGFTPDVKVWEVCFSKSGEYKEVKRAFELKGHTSGIYCFSFSNDSSRMASLSKDGTWKLWDTNIEYQKGQEPYLLNTGDFSCNTRSLISISPDGRTFAIASLTNVTIYSAVTGEKEKVIEDIHTDPANVLQFSPSSQYLLVAVGKHIRVFHNVAGYKNTIKDLEMRKSTAATYAIRDRLQVQIDEAKAALKPFKSLLD